MLELETLGNMPYVLAVKSTIFFPYRAGLLAFFEGPSSESILLCFGQPVRPIWFISLSKAEDYLLAGFFQRDEKSNLMVSAFRKKGFYFIISLNNTNYQISKNLIKIGPFGSYFVLPSISSLLNRSETKVQIILFNICKFIL